ncbi:transglutaminase family protein [Agromyces sp. Leaf222]|uniref:transglutaminase-like domain-containing protein n=1 Tax=Agromyces sp. Leaf222 TaxID=1735688 RepID=UPI0006F5FD49|nr:transglutaminase family protein [Agromyces sp. Leaf222]KQM81550.1 transglutaminase [Agromyces sp. Leaf222]
MQRTVSARIDLTIEDPARLVFMLAVAGGAPDERLELLANGVALDAADVLELTDAAGSRLHVVEAPAGSLSLSYSATVDGQAAAGSDRPLDLVEYLRPSRYCESDRLGATAVAEFSGLEGHALLDAVSSWVGTRLAYVPGSSGPSDGAVQTLLAREGVCRDYAHLVIALLRSLDVPARLAAVYAPGLDPMDFHAVAEAYVEGAWHVVDATALAPRSTLLRISTGRDAADTAFLSSYGGFVQLDAITVTATADTLPADDIGRLVQLR